MQLISIVIILIISIVWYLNFKDTYTEEILSQDQYAKAETNDSNERLLRFFVIKRTYHSGKTKIITKTVYI